MSTSAIGHGTQKQEELTKLKDLRVHISCTGKREKKRERDCILAQATVLIKIEEESSYKNKVLRSSHRYIEIERKIKENDLF